MLIDDSLRDTVRRLRVITHQMRVDKVDSEAVKFVSHILVAGADEVVAKVAYFAEGSKELRWGNPIDLHHALLGVFAAEDADEGLEVLGDPPARLLAIFGHGLVNMRCSKLLLVMCLG